MRTRCRHVHAVHPAVNQTGTIGVTAPVGSTTRMAVAQEFASSAFLNGFQIPSDHGNQVWPVLARQSAFRSNRFFPATGLIVIIHGGHR